MRACVCVHDRADADDAEGLSEGDDGEELGLELGLGVKLEFGLESFGFGFGFGFSFGFGPGSGLLNRADADDA